jgi:hypothetical protein
VAENAKYEGPGTQVRWKVGVSIQMYDVKPFWLLMSRIPYRIRESQKTFRKY